MVDVKSEVRKKMKGIVLEKMPEEGVACVVAESTEGYKAVVPFEAKEGLREILYRCKHRERMTGTDWYLPYEGEIESLYFVFVASDWSDYGHKKAELKIGYTYDCLISY